MQTDVHQFSLFCYIHNLCLAPMQQVHADCPQEWNVTLNAVLNETGSSGVAAQSLSVNHVLISNDNTVYNITGLLRERRYTLLITVHNGSYVADWTRRDVSE